MPTLILTDDQAQIVIESLKARRGLMMKDWGKAFSAEELDADEREYFCEKLDAEIMQVVDVRKRIEAALAVQKGVRTHWEVVQLDFQVDGMFIPVIMYRDDRDALKAVLKELVIVDHTPTDVAPNAQITLEEANRRHAIAKMVIAELKAAEAIDDHTFPGGSMKSDPVNEIRDYFAATS